METYNMCLPSVNVVLSSMLLCTTFTVVDVELRVSLSWQMTTVPFTVPVAGLISNLDISG